MKLGVFGNGSNDRCFYCSENLADSVWTSEHHMRIHYKTATCDCGKKNFVKVGFEGSGHDDWGDLERAVRKKRSL